MTFVETEPGVRLFVRDDGPADRPPVLLLNSLAADHSMWREVVQALNGDLRTLRFDARGHGRSTAPPAGYDLERLARDALAVLDAHQVGRATLCGLSLGGLVAMKLARIAPGRVARLVLANTALSFPPPAMWLARAAQARADGLDGLVAPTLDRWLTAPYRQAQPGRTAEIGAMIAATHPQAYAAGCELLAAADLSGEVAAIGAPITVIVGDRDPSTPPQRGLEIANTRPEWDMSTLPAAHLSAVEAPVGFACALAAFAGAAA